MNKGKTLLAIFLFSLLSIGFSECRGSYHTVTMVKPKKRWFPYDASKDRKKKRTKTVKYKAIK